MKLLKAVVKEASDAKEYILEDYFEKNELKVDIHDAVTIAFIEDLAGKAKTLKFLMEKEYVYINTISRSIFETSIYLDLLLSKDNKIYGRSYRAYVFKRGYNMYSKIISEDEKGKEIRNWLGVNKSEFINGSPSKFENDLERIREEYLDVFSKRKEGDEWYNLDGDTWNFRKLCKKVGKEHEYEMFYKILSSEVHSLNVLDKFRFTDEGIFVIDGIKGSEMHINMTTKLVMETIRKAYRFYGLHKRLRSFNKLMEIKYNLQHRGRKE